MTRKDYLGLERTENKLNEYMKERVIWESVMLPIPMFMMWVVNRELNIVSNIGFLMFTIIVIVLAVERSIRVSSLKEEVNYLKSDISYEDKIEKDNVLNNIIDNFDKSKKYREYAERSGVKTEEFIKELVFIRDNLKNLERYMEAEYIERMYKMLVESIIRPPKYGRNSDRELLIEYANTGYKVKRYEEDGAEVLAEEEVLIVTYANRIREVDYVSYKEIDLFRERVNG